MSNAQLSDHTACIQCAENAIAPVSQQMNTTIVPANNNHTHACTHSRPHTRTHAPPPPHTHTHTHKDETKVTAGNRIRTRDVSVSQAEKRKKNVLNKKLSRDVDMKLNSPDVSKRGA